MERIGTYLAIAMDYDAQAFARRHAEGFMLLDQRAHDLDIEDLVATGGAGFGLQTGTVERPSLDALQQVQRYLQALDEGAQSLLVFRLLKQAANPFKSWVTVGRARNNDIVLPVPSISKLHAYFSRPHEGGPWTVTDSGSRNGTAVNGAAIAPQQAIEIRSGDLITLGTLSLTHYDADDLYRLLQSMLAAGRQP